MEESLRIKKNDFDAFYSLNEITANGKMVEKDTCLVKNRFSKGEKMTKELLYKETKKMLETLCALKEIACISIKGVKIPSAESEEKIRQGIEASFHDQFSDVDIKAVVRPGPKEEIGQEPYYKRYFSRLGLDGQVLGCAFSGRFFSEQEHMETETVRLCLKSGFRMDLICMLDKDEGARKNTEIPAPDKKAVLKERDWKADQFWFIAIQALGKLYRRDYLIGDHLAHMLLMEGLVLQMEERDKRLNTRIHRYGGKEELTYRKIDGQSREAEKVKEWIKGEDETFRYIAESIFRAVSAYDLLKIKENPDRESRSGVFLEIWEKYAGFTSC